ncbi:MAG: hypothetical protein AAF576_00970 [Pseudomonadota bacterium]
MRAVVFAFLVVFQSALSAQAQSDMQICTQATPQFPQACGCVIQRAQAAGIVGSTLSKLLANDVATVPLPTFQVYGAIYVGCIQEAVMASAGGGLVPQTPIPQTPQPQVPVQQVPVQPTPAPLAPLPTAPAPAAPPPLQPLPDLGQAPAQQRQGTSPTTILGQPVLGPVINGRPFTQATGEPITMFMREALAPGAWGNVSVIRGSGRQRGGAGVHDGQGRMLTLECRGSFLSSRAYMVLGGVSIPEASVSVRMVITRGNGSILIETNERAVAMDGPFLMMGLSRNIANAIRAGSRLRFEVANGPVVEFGLSGSSAAINTTFCGDERFAYNTYAALEFWVPNGGWKPSQIQISPDKLPDPALRHEAGAPYVPSLSLTCDRRLVASQIFGYGFPTEGAFGVDALSGWESRPLQFTERGPFSRISQPLTDEDIALLAGAEIVGISFDQNVEPGEFTVAYYRMDGFAEALQGLECPPPPGPIAATARIDGTVGAQWRPTDMGRLFNGMADNPPFVPGVFYRSDREDVPTLGMQCGGGPFVMDPWPGPNFTVRMTLDGNPATTRDVVWGSSRSQYFPWENFDGMEAMILNGRTLRMTLVSDPRLDVLYSLEGLQQALRAAGCP